MTLAAIAGALTGNRMVGFHSDPRVQATELLLQERVPRHAPLLLPRPDEAVRVTAPVLPAADRHLRSPHTAFPHAQFLSNGNYTVVVTNAGGGAASAAGVPSRGGGQDATRDPGGQCPYLRDVRSGEVWSATHQPIGRDAEDVDVAFTMGKATFQRRDGEIATRLDVAVSPEDDVEVRRLVVTNHGDRARELDVTSYAEIVLVPQADDLAHPAFGKLFVESEYVREVSALLCRRRPRSRRTPRSSPSTSSARRAGRGDPWSGRPTAGASSAAGADRRIRRRSTAPLSGATGVLIDPIVSLRQRAARAGRRRATLVRHRDGVEPRDGPRARAALS